ncbi:MAG: exodeoxyribonuclease VII large subunit [Burkholderiaceae bacterium]|nr:exodeoxyribonuclease VII large subunit [Burkholderiaceae bacterium]
MNPEATPSRGAPDREVLSVSELNRAVATLLERNVPPLWVRGELSNVTRAASGHWYLTLKDDDAQVRAVMFRNRAQAIGFVPRNGDQVEVRALAGMYQPRGEFQLNVETMRKAGEGGLYQRFVQLREKLREEGLFDVTRKRALPPMPRCVGVITSAQAAALRDVLTTLARRAPQVPVILYPTPVQGSDAPSSIRAALRAAIRRAECDVLLLVRGGGSIEDLWAFNDEALAREIAASPIPLACGVGHESDFTIADFVADHRAATPTAAAQAAVPDRRGLLERCAALALGLARGFERSAATREQRVDTAARLLRPPSAQWRERARRLESIEWRLRAAGRVAGGQRLERLGRLNARLRAPQPERESVRVALLAARAYRARRTDASSALTRVEALAHKLHLVSPQAVLERGYAIVTRAGGDVVRAAAEIGASERLAVQLAAGTLDVEVKGRTA